MLDKIKKIYINNSGAVNVEEDMSFNQGDKNVSYIHINGIDISILTQAKIKTPGGQIITKTCSNVDLGKNVYKQVLVPCEEAGKYQVQIIQSLKDKVSCSNIFEYTVDASIE